MKTVNILSADTLFAQMLCIELCEAGYSATVGRSSLPDLVILDLDSVEAVQGLLSLTFSKYKNADLHRPFDMDEFLEMVRQRLDTEKREPVSRAPELYVSEKEYYAVFKNERIDLSELEHKLLLLLYRNSGKAVGIAEISRSVFGVTENTNLIRVYINYLRKKLDKRYDKIFIQSIRGKGYMLKEENDG